MELSQIQITIYNNKEINFAMLYVIANIDAFHGKLLSSYACP